MENNKLLEQGNSSIVTNSLDINNNDSIFSIRFTEKEELEYYLSLTKQLIKLLYMIEDEKKGQGSAELYFYGFIYELRSANTLCKNKLTKVCVKMYGLFDQFAYKQMQHSDIKRQIFECKGIVEYLIKQIPCGNK